MSREWWAMLGLALAVVATLGIGLLAAVVVILYRVARQADRRRRRRLARPGAVPAHRPRGGEPFGR